MKAKVEGNGHDLAQKLWFILNGTKRNTLVLPKIIEKLSVQIEDMLKKPLNHKALGELLSVADSFFIEIQGHIKRKGSEKIPEEYLSALLVYIESHEKSGYFLKEEDEELKTIISFKGKQSEKVDELKLKANYALYLKKLREELNKGEEGNGTKDKIMQLLQQDRNHVLDTTQLYKFGDYDILKSYFYSVNYDGNTMKQMLANKNVELIAYTIFPESIIEAKGERKEPTEESTGGYIESLSAMKRLDFIIKNFNVSNVLIGKENEQADGSSFYGSLLFEMEDSDVVIVEDFYKGKPGQEKESYAKATYILGKTEALELIKSKVGRSQIKQDNKSNNAFTSINHTGESYYARLLERYEMVKNAIEHGEIEQVQKESKNNKKEEKEAYKKGKSSEKENKNEGSNEPKSTENSNKTNEKSNETEKDERELPTENINQNDSVEYSEKEKEVADLISNLIRVASLEYSIEQVDRLHELVVRKIKNDSSVSKTEISETENKLENEEENVKEER